MLFLVVAPFLFVPVDAAKASFITIETFEGLALGPIDDQNGWVAASETSTVASDPAGGDNQVLSVITESTRLHKGALVLSDTVRMLFLRFRYADQLNFSLGMSDQLYPTQFGDFEVELSMTNATSELRINDDGGYEVIDELAPSIWYNCWLYIDNAADETQVWLHQRNGEPATAEDQLDADDQIYFAFRSGTSADLKNFFIKTGGGSGLVGPLYIDDIYLEDTDALNLSNPSAQPTAAPVTSETVPQFAIQPNPFNPRTEIRWQLAAPAHLRLRIFDMSGRLIASLAEGEFAAGDHALLWTGTTTSGAPAPTGIYFMRCDSESGAQMQKMTLIR
jgi:hypothetical protein